MNAVIYEALIDTISNPIVFVDNDHVIRYLKQGGKSKVL